VNCATPKTPSISIENLDYLEYEKHINFNIRSNFYLIQNVLPNFKRNKGGKVIFLTSLYTDSVPPQGLSYYVTAKHALNGFMKSMSIELAKYAITVNAVSPGMTETELISDVPEKTKMLLRAKIPLSRLSSPQDVAGTVDFLASDASNYITGETIRINGGQSMI
jgi:3-oxoacyl-[acyl-carrier protein] reductase